MGKAVLIMILGTIGIFGIINVNMNNSIVNEAQGAFDYYKEVTARNIANSTAEMLLSQIADSNLYRANSQVQINLFGGTAAYTAIDSTIASESYIRIRATGNYDGITKTSVVLAQIPSEGFIPAAVKAVISTNNPVEVSGGLIVDGRDHDLNGNVLSSQGTLGVWSTSSITQSGNAKIGGTYNGTDYVPAKPPDANTYDANETWAGGYPNTPDKVLGSAANGFPEGTLKSIAQSGLYGSQHVTNPNYLNYPLRGVTYVELPSGGSWISSNIDGTGILIIHNSATNAIIKNENLGTFEGLIIADDIIHIHTTIIGAVIGLTTSPSEGNCIGNGSGAVLFSRQAIMDATGSISGVGSNYGFAKHRITAAHWFE